MGSTASTEDIPLVNAAGIIIFLQGEPAQFLLMKHKHRWDLPKGHCEQGESFLQTALRETEEETGIAAELLCVDPVFQFEIRYLVDSKRHGKHEKHVVYFLAHIAEKPDIRPTEHQSYNWFPWPSSDIQKQTIDPLLAAVAEHAEKYPEQFSKRPS